MDGLNGRTISFFPIPFGLTLKTNCHRIPGVFAFSSNDFGRRLCGECIEFKVRRLSVTHLH